MFIRKISLAVTLIVAALSSTAQAAVVYYQFSGLVTFAAATSPLAALGDIISGTFAYDDAASVTPTSLGPWGGLQASYTFASLGMTGAVNGHSISTLGSIVNVKDHASTTGLEDVFDIAGIKPSVDGGVAITKGSFGFTLNSANPNALTSTSLPSSLNLASFDSTSPANNGWLKSTASVTLLQYSITSVTLVPEPGALSMMALGLLCIGAAYRRK